MKALDIVKILMENLPKYTSSVSSVFNPDGISIAGDIVSVNKTSHGLVNNQIISVVGTDTTNEVDSLTVDADDVATVTTLYDNDLTVGYHDKVRLQSATEPTIDGEYTLIDQLDSKTFYISGFTFAGVIPGDIKLIESRSASIDGFHQITLVDDDNFTYVSNYELDENLTIIPSTVNINYNLRISRGADIERLIAHYNAAPPKDLELRVVLGGTTINKDSGTYTDSDMEQGGTNDWTGFLLEPFSVYCFQTLGDDSTGGGARDDMVDLRIDLFKSLLGKEITTNTAAGVNDAVYPIGDDVYKYQKSYYVHQFDFAQQAMISLEDTSQADTVSVAVNSVEFDIVDTDTGANILITGEVDLRDSN